MMKRMLVRQKLDLVRDEYQRIRDRSEGWDSSTGLVALYGGSGGHSGRTSDLTAMKAYVAISNSSIEKNARAWFELVMDVYVELHCRQGKGLREATHDRALAWVLHERIFEGRTNARIVDRYKLRNDKTISRYYAEVVDICMGVAEYRGLV